MNVHGRGAFFFPRGLRSQSVVVLGVELRCGYWGQIGQIGLFRRKKQAGGGGIGGVRRLAPPDRGRHGVTRGALVVVAAAGAIIPRNRAYFLSAVGTRDLFVRQIMHDARKVSASGMAERRSYSPRCVSVRRRTRKEITRKLTERGLVSIAFGKNVSLAAREAVYIMTSGKNGSGYLISCRLIVSCMRMQQPDHLTLFHIGMSYEVGNH